MFRASPWIAYDPHQLPHNPHHQPDPEPARPEPEPDAVIDSDTDMDAPEISILREEEEETTPPDSAQLSFSKFRVNLRGQSSTSSASAVGPPLGPPPVHHRPHSPPDSDDDDEEDQLIDDDELAIVTETGRALASSPASTGLALIPGSPTPTSSPRKRGSLNRGRHRRGGVTGRRGRPGREPPDAAAMMSTFELAKTDHPQPSSSAHAVSPPSAVSVPVPPPQLPGPSTGDWSSAAPQKPPRKKPGPKKGSTLGPRGPRKNAVKNSQLASGRGTPVLDDSLLPPDSSTFLVPAPPSIPPTPGSDQPPLPPHYLPPIPTPDLTLDPSIPIPIYPLPSRSFPVQAPPKTPAGYAATHPLDTRSTPARKWKLAQREIKGIAGGRWFARTWVGERDKGPTVLRHVVPSPPPVPPPQMDSLRSRPSDIARDGEITHPPPSRQDTSAEPEPESPPRSLPGTNGSPEPGDGPRIPS